MKSKSFWEPKSLHRVETYCVALLCSCYSQLAEEKSCEAIVVLFTRGVIRTTVGRRGHAVQHDPGVTEISGKVYHLHMTILYICCAIGLVVFGVMIYAMINHRKSKGAVASHFHESTKVEIAWTILPFIILILMAIPATKTLIAMEDPSDADLTVKVTGSQWKWHYSYFDQDIDFTAYSQPLEHKSTVPKPKVNTTY